MVKIWIGSEIGGRSEQDAGAVASLGKLAKGGTGFGFRSQTSDRTRDRFPVVRRVHVVHGRVRMGDH